MRRLIQVAFAICAVLILGGASQPTGYTGNTKETVFSWFRTGSSKGTMIVDSSVTSANDTTLVVTGQWGADSILFRLYVNAGDTTGTPDTTWIIAEGLDKWGNAIDTSLLVVDTLNDSIQDNLFSIWNTKCINWPFMRLLRSTVEDTTSTGYQRDSIYGTMYRLDGR